MAMLVKQGQVFTIGEENEKRLNPDRLFTGIAFKGGGKL
ncbi:hypothetical protein MUY_002877 [Bacillus licheniformis WX-02]|nr:hypothetical protein MUY_002877 [Bacillus licheniformis WX-02]